MRQNTNSPASWRVCTSWSKGAPRLGGACQASPAPGLWLSRVRWRRWGPPGPRQRGVHL